jgi:hypothetical protein
VLGLRALVPKAGAVIPIPIGFPGDLPDPACWPVVELDGVAWHVAPVYLGPVSRAQALAHADAYACELPSRALVDAIWAAADLRLDPSRLARDPAKPGAAERHARHVVALVEDAAEHGGGPFVLLAGSHKDFAREGGRVDLYGWHDLTGRPVQPWGTSHSADYVDYSQGLRLVRRMA